MSRRTAIGWAALGAGVSAAAIFALTPIRQSIEVRAEAGRAVEEAERATSSGRDGEVRVDRAEQERIGLTLAPVAATTAPALARGFARGLDTGALAAIEAEIVTARAAADASQAEAARLALLASQDQSASVKSVQAARAQAAADAARVDLAVRRIGLEYGAGLARRSPAARRALIADIAAGRAALVRIDAPGASLADLSHVRVDEGGGSIIVLGSAAAADARLQSAGMLAILRGPVASSATNGRVLGVTVEKGRAATGVAVPRGAVLRWRGGLWVYRQDGPEVFTRIELVDARQTTDGWFVESGLVAGSQVAVGAAGTLLAIDRGGGTAPDAD